MTPLHIFNLFPAQFIYCYSYPNLDTQFTHKIALGTFSRTKSKHQTITDTPPSNGCKQRRHGCRRYSRFDRCNWICRWWSAPWGSSCRRPRGRAARSLGPLDSSLYTRAILGSAAYLDETRIRSNRNAAIGRRAHATHSASRLKMDEQLWAHTVILACPQPASRPRVRQ